MRTATKLLVNFIKKEDGPTAGENANSTFSMVGSTIKPTTAS